VIRRLRPGDEELHVELARRFKAHAPTPAASAGFLADDSHCLLAAFEGTQPVGFAFAHVLERWDGRRHVFFYEVGVERHARRRGHGRALVEELTRFARDAGAFEMWVEAERGDEAANAFYAAVGAARDVGVQSWVWRL
jgi:aminoglycoside 3-N-acetyltransferase I